MQYMVPQFIDVEDKIFGPITTRQFVIILIGGTLEFVLFKLLRFWTFTFFGLLILAATGTLAFMRVNAQPFHFFLLNLVQTMRRPRLKVWDKTLTSGELRELMREAPEKPPPPPPTKEPLSVTKLQELSLIVNTGGVYRSGS
ncbi:MAG: PrgI family protein [bacterium]|nr:PrgI family protein [bacterium]